MWDNIMDMVGISVATAVISLFIGLILMVLADGIQKEERK